MRVHTASTLLSLVLVFVSTACRGDSPDTTVLSIESGVPQLFVDDYLIDRSTKLQRTLHQPKKDDDGNEPILELTDEFAPYASTLEANGSIVYDPKLQRFVMFALGFAPQLREWGKVRLYRFTSKDGIHWEKGPDGRAELVYPKSQDMFLDEESGTYATNIDLFSCFYDVRDSAFPYKGWQWFANWGDQREGIYYMRSADGKSWERLNMVVGIQDGHVEQDGYHLYGAGDVTTFVYDEPHDRFLALVKYSNRDAIGPGNRQRARAFLYLDDVDERIDLGEVDRVDLVPPAKSEGGDAPHDEYYSSTAWRYGSHWLGSLKVWHGGGDHPWSSAGCAYLKLISSHDGLHWQKVPFKNEDGYPEVFIANGPEGGNNGRNDGGYITEFSNPPLRIDDELIFYYGSSSWGKNHPRGRRVTGGGIFRARLRPDGFVSVDSGEMTTKLLKFDGENLMLNSSGRVTVAILDNDFHSLAETDINGDSLSHLVKFGDRNLKSFQSPDGIRLQFKIGDDGKLYSFTVR